MALVSKAFQDIITFSRASSGTYVNSNGYITNSSVLNYLTYSNQPENAAWTKSNSFVQQNLLTYSQDFDNAGAWGLLNVAAPTPNTTIAPDGTLTADTLTCSAGLNTHNIQQVTTLTGTPVTFSVYLKAGTHSFIQIFHGSLLTTYANFNLSTGVLGTVGASFTASITAVANGFYRCTVSFTPPSNSAFRIAFISSATAVYNESWTAAGTETVFAWGAQLVQGSVPGDYRATTSAALPCLYADYNGALRARKLCEDATASVTHRILPGAALTIDAAGTYTYSWYVKAGELTEARLTDNNVLGATFNLTTGASSSVSSGYTASSVSLSNGWWRLSISGAAVTANGRILIYLSKAGSTTYTGDGSSGIYIADAQLNDGSSALAYYDTTASAYNAPRFDYDPVTLAAKGLLVEEQRVNLLTYSNAFTSAPWVAGANTNLTATSALSPDGTVNAWKLYASNGLVAAGLRQPITKAASALTYAASVYAKAAGQNWLQLTVFDGTVGNRYWYNVSTGALGTTAAIGAGFTGVSASIVPAGNGYYRCVLVATSSTATTYEIYIYPSAADGSNGTGDASNNGVYIFGSQLE